MLNKTAFVTGGTGFIGLNLVEHLTQSGWDVIALHRPNSRLTHLQKYPVRLVEGAIEDAASLARAMPDDVDAVLDKALSVTDQSVVIDFRVDPEEMVFPMVPAGASNDEIILGPEFVHPVDDPAEAPVA